MTSSVVNTFSKSLPEDVHNWNGCNFLRECFKFLQISGTIFGHFKCPKRKKLNGVNSGALGYEEISLIETRNR